MFYAIKTFLSEVTVALLDEEKRPFTFYFIRTDDVNLGDIYFARITQKMREQKGFFAEIGRGRTVYVSSKQPLEIGQKLPLIISKEARMEKLPEAKRYTRGIVLPHNLGLIQKGDILAGFTQVDGFIQIPWEDEFDDFIADAADMYVPFADGARLIIEATHAFHTIDVDSGASTKPFAELNLLAARQIASEIIKRNISGNILIDFIGEKRKNDVAEWKNIMSRELCKSPVPYTLYNVTAMGNVELRRTRLRTPLYDAMHCLSFKAFAMFKEVLANPEHVKDVKAALSLYAHLSSLLAEQWKDVQKRAGTSISLIAATNVTDYQVDYK